jgi:ribosomal protein S12 methylthiotransferase accessory factor
MAEVTVLGHGRLRDALDTALGAAPGGGTPRGGRVVVAVTDTEDTSCAEAGRRAADTGACWLPVRMDCGWVDIGPAVRPGVAGCPTCVERRRSGNRPDAAGRAAMRRAYGDELASRPCGSLAPTLAATVGALVASEARCLGDRPGTAWSEGALVRISAVTGEPRRHRFVPDPLCPDCGDLPPDTPQAAVPAFAPAPKPDPSTLRVGGIAALADRLRDRFVDPETGLVQGTATDVRGGGVIAIARLAPALTVDDTHHGYGRCDDATSARTTAVLEALERVASTRPSRRRTTTRAAYADVADVAVDPRTLGLYPDDWYERPGFWFARFDPRRPTRWVWGYSFAADAPVLVPESYVYFGPQPPDDHGLAYESSNGCAVGGCTAEAVLYGLLEVAERDAALATWYARVPRPRVDLGTAADRRIPLVAERVRQRFGYEVTAYLATMEQDVPVFWVTAGNVSGAPDRPAALCGSAAHTDPEHALLRALDDLGPMLASHIAGFDRDRAARLAADPDLVTLLADHPTVYADPGAARRLEFLHLPGPDLSLRAVSARLAWPAHRDLGGDLAELVGRYLDSGLDVIAVRTTPEAMRAEGLESVKVIVPGSVSITFGHRYRRTHGLPRLYSLPRLLGLRDRDLHPDELNPHPHPFP